MTEDKNRQTWLYGVIIILLLVLVAETGYLIYNQVSKQKAWTSRPKIKHHDQLFAPKWGVKSPASPASSPAMQQSPDDFWTDPFTELERMRQGMNRLFTAVRTYGPPLAHSITGEGFFDFVPAIDIEDKGKFYLVQGDLPGLDKDKIEIQVQGKLLSISGVREVSTEQKDEDAGFYSQERSYGSFSRVLTLPGPVDETAVKASYENGVLKITLPKTAEAASSKKVAIQ